MNTSLFELFKIGIGPSSSHTVGPMRAALRFVRELENIAPLDSVSRVTVDLYGSLALTGIGHGTDRAILLGLMGEAPETLDPASVEQKITTVRTTSELLLGGRKLLPFTVKNSDSANDLRFCKTQMYPDPDHASHPNGMRFRAYASDRAEIYQQVYFSIGGGFIVSESERLELERGTVSPRNVPYPFHSADDLLTMANEASMTIAELVLANECALLQDPTIEIRRPQTSSSSTSAEDQVKAAIQQLWQTMDDCVNRGLISEGILPGGLKVRRRAPALARRLSGDGVGKTSAAPDSLAALDWVTMWAMAVNEENAAGGRVVTAPTNGAAGVIPAVALYYLHFASSGKTQSEREEGLLRYFLTAAAIGILYKENASISGAEVGCQGEVGVACSMAAAGLVAAQGGSNDQVEHAAEIGMEHNLGMTCDPIGGLVQIPCIERNGMGAVKAINASRIAMYETEGHKLSLDQVIRTMYETGMDMQSRYKETSLAGLALNVIEC